MPLEMRNDIRAMDADGVAVSSVVSVIPSNLRRISVQEAAVIQTFPRDMPWHGSQSSRYRQIGNAVPPKMSYAVATSVANALGLNLTGDPSLLDKLG